MRRRLIQLVSTACCLLLLAPALSTADDAPFEEISTGQEAQSPAPIPPMHELGEQRSSPFELLGPAPQPHAILGVSDTPAPTLVSPLHQVAELRFGTIELPPAPHSPDTLRVDAITLSRIDDVMQFGDWVSPAPRVFRLAQIEAEQPFDVSPPSFATEAFQPFDVTGGIADRPAGFGSFGLPETYHPLLDTTPAVEQIGAGDQLTLAVEDAGALLLASEAVQTVSVQRRSPVAFDTRIRGYNFNQIYTVGDGAFWTPVREDLDSMLAKMDPTLIQGMTVVAGPYGVRYGPGFSFIDVATAPTPRYDGYEAHNRFGLTYHGNSERIYGRDTYYGGNSDYGFIVSYGSRTGNDYSPGGNSPISTVPSRYDNQNYHAQFGYDLSPDSDIELRFAGMAQADTDYAAQFFDVNSLVTNGFNLAYNYESPMWHRTTRIEAWVNATNFDGDTSRKRFQSFPVIERVDAALNEALTITDARLLGSTSGDLTSAGARGITTWGAEGNSQLALGADIRFIDQALVENFAVSGSIPDPIEFSTNQPRAQLHDPGLFAELTLPSSSSWTTKIGGRVDFFESSADARQVRTDTSLPGVTPGDPSTFGVLDQNEVLLAFYLTNEIQLDDYTTVKVGGGHAQRAPSLRERYADGVFLGIIQSGFSRVIGNPSVRKERAWQIDAGIDYEDDIWRGKIHAFGSWIDDYITYTGNIVSPPLGARLLQTINTDYATLAGFEAAGEVNLTPTLSAYASVGFVDGRDHGINRALSQIGPMHGRIGIHWQDASDERRWGTDIGLRIVDNQDMVGYLHAVAGGGPDPIPVEVPTAGFTVAYLRGFYNFSENVNLVGGIENLFDNNYLEHLDLRLPDETIGTATFANTAVFSPGITPYIGLEWTN